MKYNNKNNKLLIWDSNEIAPKGNWDLILWSNTINNSQDFSILKFIEDNGIIYKEKYSTFVNDIGKKLVNKKTIIEILQIRENFSFWWMTNLHQKNVLNDLLCHYYL